ncbi:MAG: class I SAM-dependent methyltransferase [Bacteroidia bacterium]|nr:class I SAM-dependent methyltransferase [Bacteroidia bacterium]
MKKRILRFLKRLPMLNLIRRVLYATQYPLKQLGKVIKWGFTSREDTNYTYDLSDDNMLFMAHFIAVVTGKQYKDVLTLFDEIQQDSSLRSHVLDEIKKSPLGRFADKEVRLARRIGWYAFVRIVKPKVVIETGIDKGLGSVVLCAALLKNKEEGYIGKYYGLDINPEAGYLLSGKYTEVGEVLYNDSIESLKTFNEPIDLFINDSDHSLEYEYNEYKTIAHLLTDQSIILGDNSHCSDKLALFSQETNRRFLFFKEEPINHWYEGAGIGVSFK